MEDLLPLAVGKLDIEHPTVRFYHRQGVELSLGRPIAERIEVPPVNLHLFTRSGFEADKGLSVFQGLIPSFLKIIPDNRDLAVKPLSLKSLKHYGGFNEGIL
jgi:hypothetical protein